MKRIARALKSSECEISDLPTVGSTLDREDYFPRESAKVTFLEGGELE